MGARLACRCSFIRHSRSPHRANARSWKYPIHRSIGRDSTAISAPKRFFAARKSGRVSPRKLMIGWRRGVSPRSPDEVYASRDEERQMSTNGHIVSSARLQNLIYLIRGEKVMLDADLAALYEVTPKALNQAV